MGVVADSTIADLRAVFTDAAVRGPVTDLVDQLLEVADGIGLAAHCPADDVARRMVTFLAGVGRPGVVPHHALARYGILGVELPAAVGRGDAVLIRVRSIAMQAERILSNLREGSL